MIKNWINGNEKSFLEGQSARFGASLPISLSKAIKLPAALANPFDSCTKLSSKVEFLHACWPTVLIYTHTQTQMLMEISHCEVLIYINLKLVTRNIGRKSEKLRVNKEGGD